MKLSDFILLNEEEKKIAVLHAGVLVAKRRDTNSFAFLFQVDNFYVETCFNVHTRTVKEFRMFDQTNLLQPYLESIRIDELLN